MTSRFAGERILPDAPWTLHHEPEHTFCKFGHRSCRGKVASGVYFWDGMKGCLKGDVNLRLLIG